MYLLDLLYCYGFSESLYAVVRPSVCLSVTFVHPTQTIGIFANIFIYPSFLRIRMVGGGRPLLGEILG